MRKGSLIAFLTLVPVLAVSSTNPGKRETGTLRSNRTVTVATLLPQGLVQNSPSTQNDSEGSQRVIMVLQTREYTLTIYGGDEHAYSVGTLEGVALAEKLSAGELKARFPELHELVNEGWACDSPMAKTF